MNQESSTKTLFDFDKLSEIEQWISVNDGVMGGLSVGKISLTKDSCLLFNGSLSLDNNGGFSSIRTQTKDFSLSNYKGIKIRIKGDGRKYQFRLRLDDSFDGIAFKHEFETIKDTWMEIELLFNSFIPTYRGRTLRNIPPVQAENIKQIGFLLADKTTGEFTLFVDKIIAIK